MPLASPSGPPLVTAPLCRAARAALLWTQYDLADRSGVSRVALADWERGHSRLQRRNLARVQAAFEAAGVRFLPAEPDAGTGGDTGLGLRFPAILPAGREGGAAGDDGSADVAPQGGRRAPGGRTRRARMA